jgi:hypothetical protein
MLGWRMVALRRALRQCQLLTWLLVVLTMLGGSGAWHTGDDDPDCLAAPFAHDHSSHHAQFGTPSHPAPPVHCAICHWLQAFRSDAAAQPHVPGRPDDEAVAVRPVTVPLRSAARIDLPSRAPPA